MFKVDLVAVMLRIIIENSSEGSASDSETGAAELCYWLGGPNVVVRTKHFHFPLS